MRGWALWQKVAAFRASGNTRLPIEGAPVLALIVRFELPLVSLLGADVRTHAAGNLASLVKAPVVRLFQRLRCQLSAAFKMRGSLALAERSCDSGEGTTRCRCGVKG